MNSRNIANAIDIVTSFSCNRYPIDPVLICNELGIKVIDDKALGKDGYLVCGNGKKLIFVNGKITNRHRKNFIIAHELGHFLLHREFLYSCDRISVVANRNVNTADQEREANEFATELLIPNSKIRRILPTEAVSFSCIREIAAQFDVSVTHAAIQAVVNSNAESEVLICYENGKLKWYRTAHRYTYPRMIPRQCPIDINTARASTLISGEWTELYDGTVCQEIFRPYGNQYLVLLSGTRK